MKMSPGGVGTRVGSRFETNVQTELHNVASRNTPPHPRHSIARYNKRLSTPIFINTDFGMTASSALLAGVISNL